MTRTALRLTGLPVTRLATGHPEPVASAVTKEPVYVARRLLRLPVVEVAGSVSA